MSPLFVRHTYWNIPCTQHSLAAGISYFQGALNAPGQGTPTAAGASYSVTAWQEFKIGTYAGRQVLLLLEVARQQTGFSPISTPRLSKLLLHQREYTFRPDQGKRKHTYLLFCYTPFRSSAYHAYQTARSLTEKISLLQQHLSYHLSELALRLNWQTKTNLVIDDIKIRKEKNLRLGGNLQASFDLAFSTNLFIPEFLGLGRGASHGLGVVRPQRGARG